MFETKIRTMPRQKKFNEESIVFGLRGQSRMNLFVEPKSRSRLTQRVRKG